MYASNNPLRNVDPSGQYDMSVAASPLGLGLDPDSPCFMCGGPGRASGLASLSAQLGTNEANNEARYVSIITTGWDPDLQKQYNETDYWFAGGGGGVLEQQTELAAIEFGRQACRQMAAGSAVADCIQQVYSILELDGPAGQAGGNYDFSYADIQINGASVDPDEDFGCFMKRCGTFDSLDYSHGDGTFHVDTTNVWFLPIGPFEHFATDIIGGNTWWSDGIPRPEAQAGP